MQEKGSSRWRFTLRESFTLKKDREDGPGIVRVHLPLPVEHAQVESFTLLRTSEEPAFISRLPHGPTAPSSLNAP